MFDESLLYELKKGSKEAFNSIFRYYYPRIMTYITFVVEPKVAEDIAQDVFLYVWEHRETLYIGKGFSTYLFQSASSRCLDYIRKKRMNEQYNSFIYERYLEDCRKLVQNDNYILEELSIQDFYRHLYEWLDKLPEQRREVFILAYIKGMTAKEIAEQTQMSQRTVESHLYLTVKYLKKRMSKSDYYMFCLIFPFTI